MGGTKQARGLVQIHVYHMNRIKHMGLFEGIGGFSLAAHWAGWDTPVMVEWNKYCQAVLQKNFPHASIFGDIHEFDGRPYAGQIDIITGGFPCQPYSHAGLRKGNDDDRALWPEMLRVIREVGPRWVVGENVAGLVSMDGGRVFCGILADLENAGYSTETYIIPAVGVGAPHERCRVWIIAHSEGAKSELSRNTRAGRDGLANENCAIANPEGVQGYVPATQNGGWDKEKESDVAGVCRAAPHAGRRNGQNGGHGSRQGVYRQTNEHGDDPDGSTWKEGWLSVATRICRVDDGLPAGVDETGDVPTKAKKKTAGKGHRIEATGNAIVPQIAFQIFMGIEQFMQHFITTET